MKSKEWTILDDLKQDDREMAGSVIALAGPRELLPQIEKQVKEFYEKVYIFHTHSDCGEFPETEGYTSKNFKDIESEMEDPALYPYMTKCLDSVLDFNNKRQDTLVRLGYMDVEGYLHMPKFGGKVMAVVGIVRAYSPDYLNKSKVFVPGNITLQ